jgi:CRP/FNR family cyclic AMP-dependent transcriptional regulator
MAGEDQLFQKFGKFVPKGTVLFKDGDSGTEMFIIQTGKVKISKNIGDQDKTLAVLPAGEFFGEMSILNNKPRSATAEVVEDSKLLVIDPKTFESMLRGNAEIAIRIIKKLSARLQETDNQLEALHIKDINRKIVYFLKRKAEQGGQKIPEGIKVNTNISQLAHDAALEEPKVAEIIDKLVKAKLLQVLPDGIVLHDITKLDKFLEFLAMKEQFGDFS